MPSRQWCKQALTFAVEITFYDELSCFLAEHIAGCTRIVSLVARYELHDNQCGGSVATAPFRFILLPDGNENTGLKCMGFTKQYKNVMLSKQKTTDN